MFSESETPTNPIPSPKNEDVSKSVFHVERSSYNLNLNKYSPFHTHIFALYFVSDVSIITWWCLILNFPNIEKTHLWLKWFFKFLFHETKIVLSTSSVSALLYYVWKKKYYRFVGCSSVQKTKRHCVRLGDLVHWNHDLNAISSVNNLIKTYL